MPTAGEEGTHARTLGPWIVEPALLAEALAYAETVNANYVLFYDVARSCVYGVLLAIDYGVDGVQGYRVEGLAVAGPRVLELGLNEARIVAFRARRGWGAVVVEADRQGVSVVKLVCGGLEGATSLRYYRVLYDVGEALDVLEEASGER